MFCTYTHALHTSECKQQMQRTHTHKHDVHKYISVWLLCAGVRKSGTPVFPFKRYSVAHPTKWESNLTNRRRRSKKQTWIENDGTCKTTNEKWTERKAKCKLRALNVRANLNYSTAQAINVKRQSDNAEREREKEHERDAHKKKKKKKQSKAKKRNGCILCAHCNEIIIYGWIGVCTAYRQTCTEEN